MWLTMFAFDLGKEKKNYWNWMLSNSSAIFVPFSLHWAFAFPLLLSATSLLLPSEWKLRLRSTKSTSWAALMLSMAYPNEFITWKLEHFPANEFLDEVRTLTECTTSTTSEWFICRFFQYSKTHKTNGTRKCYNMKLDNKWLNGQIVVNDASPSVFYIFLFKIWKQC